MHDRTCAQLHFRVALPRLSEGRPRARSTLAEFRSTGWWSGVALAVFVSVTATFAAAWIGESLLGFEQSPISAIMMAIIIGMLIGNTLGLPDALRPGLKFCASTVLRLGVMLLGIRLSLYGAGQFTLVALPFVVAAIAVALLTVTLLGRTMGLSRQLAGLIAVGTSICGCTAIVATAPQIKAHESEVSYAIACVTVFGIAAMFAYPFLAHAAFALQPELAGLFLGTSIHETAQVAGAGLMYQAQYDAPAALDIATVTKLVRNLCMVAVIPLAGYWFGGNRREGDAASVRWWALVPWFIVGFAIMSALRTLGDAGDRPFGLLSPESWRNTVEFLQHSAERLLLVAMSAIGLTSMLAGIVRIGLRPFALGLFAALLVGGVSFALISLYGAALIAALSG